jgi:hypothetical protein
MAKLRKAVEEAHYVKFRNVTLSTGLPVADKCHPNVDKFKVDNTDHKAVRGWLVSGGTGGYCLDRHSVVCDPEGRWLTSLHFTPKHHSLSILAQRKSSSRSPRSLRSLEWLACRHPALPRVLGGTAHRH